MVRGNWQEKRGQEKNTERNKIFVNIENYQINNQSKIGFGIFFLPVSSHCYLNS